MFIWIARSVPQPAMIAARTNGKVFFIEGVFKGFCSVSLGQRRRQLPLSN
jgi:hypothetical protein